MSELFKYKGDDEHYFIKTKNKHYTGDEVVDLLNEQQATISALKEENEQLKQEIKQYWKCRDKWKQEAKELKKEADYFERKKCEYWNMYNEAHSDRIILKKENEQLKQELAELLAVHTKIVETLDSEFVSKALEDGD